MKKLIILFAMCSFVFLTQTTSAQISFRINLGSQPSWGPVGYNHVEYYYLPDIEAYYYVPTHKYIYMENGSWINRSYLPGRYRDYDMNNCRKIVINEPRPYMHHNEFRDRYERINEQDNQQSYRNDREPRNYNQQSYRNDRESYNNNRNNREKFQKDFRNNRGRHEGERKGRRGDNNEGD